MQNSARRGIPYPDPGRDDAPDIPLHVKDLVNYLDLDTPWYTGTEVEKPSAGSTVEGAWYWATDSSILYLNTGTWTALLLATDAALLGNPTATTQAVGDNSTRLATTAFVRSLLPAGIGPLPWLGATAPAGWLLCDGSAVSRTTYAALFAEIGTTCGPGDGSTTFNLPDMRGRVPVGKNTGTFLTLGQQGGEEAHALTSGEMPPHTHTGTTGTETASHYHSGTTGYENSSHYHSWMVDFQWVGTAHARDGGTLAIVDWQDLLGATGVNDESHTNITGTESSDHQHSFTTGTESANHAHNFTTNSTGGVSGVVQAHNNIQPYLVVNYIIKT
jgi:microcystin-dependent protein